MKYRDRFLNFFEMQIAYAEYVRTQKPPHYYTWGAAARRRGR